MTGDTVTFIHNKQEMTGKVVAVYDSPELGRAITVRRENGKDYHVRRIESKV